MEPADVLNVLREAGQVKVVNNYLNLQLCMVQTTKPSSSKGCGQATAFGGSQSKLINQNGTAVSCRLMLRDILRSSEQLWTNALMCIEMICQLTD